MSIIRAQCSPACTSFGRSARCPSVGRSARPRRGFLARLRRSPLAQEGEGCGTSLQQLGFRQRWLQRTPEPIPGTLAACGTGFFIRRRAAPRERHRPICCSSQAFRLHGRAVEPRHRPLRTAHRNRPAFSLAHPTSVRNGPISVECTPLVDGNALSWAETAQLWPNTPQVWP